jgi:UV DNA damage endonuclease
MREVKRRTTEKERATGKASGTAKRRQVTRAPVKVGARLKTVLLPPIWTGHSDFTNPFEFATFMRAAEGLQFDVMMEGKAKDLSIIKLRPDLLRFAPDVAERFGICPDDEAELTAAEKLLDDGVTADHELEVDEGGIAYIPDETLV